MIQTEKSRPAPGTGETAESATNAIENESHFTTDLSLVLDTEHLQELEASAISPEVMTSCGVYSAHAADELPECVRWVAGHDDALPALVYPSQEADGTPVVQVKPARPLRLDSEHLTGRSAKYVSGSGLYAPQLPLLRRAEGDEPVWLIVEGVKQSLAAWSWAPDDVGVLRIAGIYGWKRDGAATEHLSVVQGGHVVVVADADARTNAMVFEGASELGDACHEAGAASVVFATVPGGATTGLDDHLAQLSEDKRRGAVKKLLASKRKKPAAKQPCRRINAAERVKINVTAERGLVARAMANAVVDQAGGEVFERAGEVVHIGRDAEGRAQVQPLVASGDGSGALLALLSQSVLTYRPTEKKEVPADPSSDDRREMLYLLRQRCRTLRGISEMPVVTRSGEVVTHDGYEPESRMYVRLSSDLADLVVPQTPSQDEAAAAVDQLLYLLQDFEFEAESDRVRAVAMLVSAVLRSTVPLAPLWMLSAVKPGQGKGKLAALGSILMSGQVPGVQTYPRADDELRKVVTSQILAGGANLFLDEVKGTLASAALQALVTSRTWSDRRLGVSEQVQMEQAMHMVVAGNNITVGVDMARRVMPVRLYTEREDPSIGRTFAISQLEEYAQEHRRELVCAVLTIVRHWYAIGCPAPTAAGNAAITLGSFEAWQHVVGGSLEAAGLTGMMDGVMEMRQALDDGSAQWQAHFGVLEEIAATKASGLFTIRDVLSYLSKEPEAPAPPEVDLSGANASHVLGRAYLTIGAVGDKFSAWYGGRRLRVSSKLTRKGSKQYYIETRAAAAGGAVVMAPAPDGDDDDLTAVSDSIAPVISDLGDQA